MIGGQRGDAGSSGALIGRPWAGRRVGGGASGQMTFRDRSGSRLRSDHSNPAIGPTNQAHRIRKGDIFGHIFRNPGYALVETRSETFGSCRRCSKRITDADMDELCDEALVATNSEVLVREFSALIFSVSKTAFPRTLPGSC